MNGTSLFTITLHFALLPVVFQLLKYIRVEEIFKKGTPLGMIKLIYVGLTVAITQLIIGYFTSVFSLIDGLFS